MNLLRVADLDVAYGGIRAIKGVSLEVEPGEVVALIGANGAGKTTLLSTVAGVLRPSGGEIEFAGEPIAGRRPEEIVRKGLALVPESRRIFGTLTVRENLSLGATIRKDRGEVEGDVEEMARRFPILGERMNQAAGTLSGGEQQQLAIARALMSRPRLLMLDEPSLGLAPLLVDEIFELIGRLRETDVTILIVEQNVERTLRLADRAYVLHTGRITNEGPAHDLLERFDVREAYLGA
jgi:branched-chain amino acid transport system ATP-binding protein